MLQGSINHVSVTVRNLDEAMAFFAPVLSFLGYSIGEAFENPSAGSRLTVNINPANGIAFNVWEARAPHADQPFRLYAPGLHHVAFNVATHEQVDRLHDLLVRLGAEILDGPAEFPYADDGLGYYAVYFLGPDRLKFECVHMPGLEAAYRAKGMLGSQARGVGELTATATGGSPPAPRSPSDGGPLRPGWRARRPGGWRC